MKLLEPHITSGLGVALKADNGMYLTIKVNDEVFQHIYADKSHKDFYTKFIVEKVDNRTIRLRNNLTKSYLSKDFGIFANQSYIVALKRVQWLMKIVIFEFSMSMENWPYEMSKTGNFYQGLRNTSY